MKSQITEPFAPLYLFGLDPLIYGLIVSFGLGYGVSLLTPPLPAEAVDRYFLEDARTQAPWPTTR